MLNSKQYWFRITEIPNFLRFQGLLQNDPPEKILEVLNQWANTLGALYHWSDELTLSLRYSVSDKTFSTSIYIGIFSKSDRILEESIIYLEQILKNIQAHYLPYNGSFPDISDSKDTTLLHFTQYCSQTEYTAIRTEQEQARRINQYTIQPWNANSKPTYQAPFTTLDSIGNALRNSSSDKQHEESLWLSIYLAPTNITLEEKQWTWNQCCLSREKNLNDYKSDKNSDPNSNLNSQHGFDQIFQRFDSSFIGLIEIVSISEYHKKNSERAYQLAHQIRSELEANNTSTTESVTLKPRCSIYDPKILYPDSQQAWDLAVSSFNNLKIRYWTTSDHLPKQAVRLPYVHNPESLARIFRFPFAWNGGVAGLVIRQPLPDYLQATLSNKIKSISIGDNSYHQSRDIPINDLTMHSLVVGSTGSGKSTTLRNILRQVAKAKIPFLVLEPAKSEYRSLISDSDFQGLKIYTPGLESINPLYINPFELLEGVRVEVHLGRLLTCLEASMPLDGPLNSIVEEGLIRVYTDAGWNSWSTKNDIETTINKRFPTMSDFREKLTEVSDSRGYQGELKNNITAAIDGRIKSLTKDLGLGKGKMLDNTISSIPFETLFKNATVIELNYLRSEDKSLVMMIIMMFLREYREQQGNSSKLKHVLLIEEAHNVLGKVNEQSGGEIGQANTKFKAVESFANLLSELRSYGQGVIIADQSPQKLLPEAIKNTNLQIAHQLRASDDRTVVSDCMVMSPEQEQYLPKLRAGSAFVFCEGMEQAGIVSPPWDGGVQNLSDKELMLICVVNKTFQLDGIPLTEDLKSWYNTIATIISESAKIDMGNIINCIKDINKFYKYGLKISTYYLSNILEIQKINYQKELFLETTYKQQVFPLLIKTLSAYKDEFGI